MSDKLDRLKELKQLWEEGSINDQEYSQLKKELLEANNQSIPKPDQNKEKKEKDSKKSYCPHCGSNDIQLQQKVDREINWGRAVAGGILFGVIGGAVGATTGKEKEDFANFCLNCGTTWRAQDLYHTKQTIKELTGFEVDLSIREHRNYLNNFLTELLPKISASSQHIQELRERQKYLKEQKQYKDSDYYITSGIIILLLALSIGVSIDSTILGLLFFIIILFVGFLAARILNKSKKNNKRINKSEQLEKEIQIIQNEQKRKALEFHNANL